jgi:hypothetical protein
MDVGGGADEQEEHGLGGLGPMPFPSSDLMEFFRLADALSLQSVTFPCSFVARAQNPRDVASACSNSRRHGPQTAEREQTYRL